MLLLLAAADGDIRPYQSLKSSQEPPKNNYPGGSEDCLQAQLIADCSSQETGCSFNLENELFAVYGTY